MKRTPFALQLVLALATLVPQSVADSGSKLSSAIATAPITIDTRFTIVRTLNAEKVFVKKPFPQGDKGITIHNGEVSPDDRTLITWSMNRGPAARPGERAQITNIEFKDNQIIFEINGGPKKKAKWYQRIQIAGSSGSTPIAPGPNPNAKGSFVALTFDKYIPDITVDQVKQMLLPVFDFGAGKSATNQYEESLPPKVRAALKSHQALVGMNRELVVSALGRPSQKIREKDGEVEYEEWMYGTPPADVQFIRFVGDEVSQVKIMKTDGTKIVRTEREVDFPTGNGTAVAQTAPALKPVSSDQRPSLRRPGEDPTAIDNSVPPQAAPPVMVPDNGGPRLPDGGTPQDNPGAPPH
ncbi:MAG: hypothetical protein HYX28_01685 [Candidatus Koribacter versatilis]|uniref:Uncharacterized protein n=1 Tax=Candidatus Korobacter versatilis TaxID=658062 RepID=A0A932EPC8_9BACT|nr:hypothetical protein [Candidatus Koribacter versatilis]